MEAQEKAEIQKSWQKHFNKTALLLNAGLDHVFDSNDFLLKMGRSGNHYSSKHGRERHNEGTPGT